MSKVALRVYNREIETLIEQGHVDEAVAYCKHILKTFPKHLETYRLLGKAYLEAHRHDDAVDIFQRVLTSVPDDFVSHLGMSIIADERKDLEQAIWHMERAFEAIPSNGGVQAELRRLYGRRDGLEPPKIQLTRGALARMYIRGGQHAQAIQEVKGVLQEEPDRLDLKLLMAQAYFRAGQKVEAIEVCNEILKASPYCFDANRILVEILPGTSLESTLATYKKRLQQLDPYLALVTGSTFDLASVQDAGVTIERLDWDESLALQAESGWQPDEQPDEQPASQTEQGSEEEAIPGWMKEQGWGPSSGEFQEGSLDFDEPDSALVPGGDLAAAEIPDWLQAMAPSDAEAGAPESESESEDADMDWLSGISAASGVGLEASEQAESPAPESVAAEGDVPDWLAGMGEEAEQPAESEPEPVAEGDVPDWIAGLGEEAEQSAAEQPVESEPVAEDGTSDWLAGLGAESEQPAAEQQAETAASGEDVPDWMAGIGEEAEQPAAEQPAEAEPVAEDDASDWLVGLGTESEQPAVEPQAESAASGEDVPDWIAGLGEESEQSAAEQPAESEPIAEGDIPDWMAGIGEETEQSAAEQPAEPAPVGDATFAGAVSGPGTTESEQDAAFKWLESLAAGQGAKPEELLTQPEERLEHAPDWVESVDGAPALTAQQAPESLESAPEPETADESDVPDWMAGIAQETEQPAAGQPAEPDVPDWMAGIGEEAGQPAAGQPAEPEPEIAAESDIPDWMAGIGEETEQSAAEQPAEPEPAPAGDGVPAGLVSGPGTTESEQDEAFKWLESLAAGQGAKPEELLTQPEERLEQAPGWVQSVDDAPPAAPEQPAEFVPEPPIEIEDEEPIGELSALLSGPGTSEPDQDEAFKWLESLAAGQGAKPEELLTQPEERINQAPGWVEGVENPQPELSEPVSGPGTSEFDQDESFKWLENLAAAQGAKPEELLTQPEERLDHSPEWVSQTGGLPPEAAPETQAEETPAAPSQPEPESEPPIAASESLEEMGVTQWLKSLNDEELPDDSQASVPAKPLLETEDLPDWLKDESADDLPPASLPVSEWVPEESQTSLPSADADSPEPVLSGVEEPILSEVEGPILSGVEEPVLSEVEGPPETSDQAPAESAPTPSAEAAQPEPVPTLPPIVESAQSSEPKPEPEPAPAPARPVIRQTGMLGGDKDAMLLDRARLLLEKSSLDTSMSEYARMIKKGKYMEEVIFDLQEATYSHPVDVIVWQTLGDAYMRNNRLQEALDAYTKAEELLR